jgi:hypothetical protein
MSNDNLYERMWKLQTQANRLVLEGKRDRQVLIDFYQKFLETPVTKTVEWKTWKTIKLGTGLKTTDDFRQALKADGHFIGDLANDIIGKPAFKVSETEQDVELVNVSVEELGFKQGACYADICKRAFELGLDLCPTEVGPQLRLRWKDQSKGTYVVVAMNAITGSDGSLFVFSLKRDGDGRYYLNVCYGGASNIWDGGIHFLFLRRKAV